MAADLENILSVLVPRGVRFIVIGGWAAALQPHAPYLRGAPPGLPFALDERTVRAGLNFTLSMALGSLDLLGEVPGGGTDELLP